jgi:hypothetical protein
MNSDPLSLRIRLGAPRRPSTRAPSRRPSAPGIELWAWSTRPSRVDSSPSVSPLRGRPRAVRSSMKSPVPMSFWNRAGWGLQLLALVPGWGPHFLVFLSLRGLRSPRPIPRRRTRLRFTDQPPRTRTACTCREPKRGCRRAHRWISRLRGWSSVRRRRRYRRTDPDRPLTGRMGRGDCAGSP